MLDKTFIDALALQVAEIILPAILDKIHPVQAIEDEFVTKAEFARLSKTTPRTIDNHIKKGKLKSYRFGRRVLVRKSDMGNVIREVRV